MRNYIYIYSESLNSITSSGLEFSDLVTSLNLNDFLFLKHEFSECTPCSKTNFDFCHIDEIKHYTANEIYNFGDLVFLDLPKPHNLHKLEKSEIAEILYFGHIHKPLNCITVKNLNNNYMVHIHDNGFYLKLFFQNSIDKLLSYIKQNMQVEFDATLLNSKYLVIQKNKVEVFNKDLGFENTVLKYKN